MLRIAKSNLPTSKKQFLKIIFLMNLNTQQKEAVLHLFGPLLVLAGAGTGKTKVLTSRIIHLINSFQASSHQILAVTFTNKAAFEMKHRILSEIGAEANNIWCGTFHSIASRILKRHAEIVGLRPDFTIIDADDQLRLVKQILNDFSIDSKNYPPKNYLYQIERFKDKALRAEYLNESDFHSHNLPKLVAVYSAYQARLKASNAADFGDLLLYNLEIFEKSFETLKYYQNKFPYILVDEYQDTNNSQYQWLIKLAGESQNICAVGDDDQSIYSWRGAQIANILRFEKDFKNTKIIRLEQNYRSTSNILKCASFVIKNNSERHKKTLWSEAKDGEKIKLFSFMDERGEAANIARIIDDFRGKIKLSDIAILVRAGYQTRAFEEAFIASSLPYKIVGGLRFFERREIKDVIAYLRVISNQDDNLALQRIINLPKRGVGEVTINGLFSKARDSNSSLFSTIKREILVGAIKGKAKEALAQFVADIESWKELAKENKLEDLAKNILHNSGYLAMWQSENTQEGRSRVENLKEFVSSLEEFSDLSQFLDHVSLVSSNEKEQNEEDMINIMTIHSAKGLEFDTVFVPGLEEGVFPSSRSIEERNGLEEERRLFYVAITRAKKNLYLSYAKNRVVFGNFQPSQASCFIKELPEDILEIMQQESYYSGSNSGYFSANFPSPRSAANYNNSSSKPAADKENSFLNKRIFHQKFGYGKVIEVNDNKLEIIFEKAGAKTVIKDFVSLA